MIGVDMSLAKLHAARLVGCDASLASFAKQKLTKADLRGTRFVDADLEGCDFSGADLRDCDLSRINFSKINLSGADLRGAILAGLDPCMARLKGTKIDLEQAFYLAAALGAEIS